MSRGSREKFDVAVIGLGTMGIAACYELARRAGQGSRVLGLDQYAIPHTLGSHHGDSRMIRLCYYEHPSYTPLLLRAYELWDDLQRESGRELLHVTGGLYMGPPREPEGELVPGTIRSGELHNLPLERLSAGEIRSRYPMFGLSDAYEGVIELRAGYLRPERVIETYAELAACHGTHMRTSEPVTKWYAEDNRIIIETVCLTYEASHLIIAGGAWASQLLGEIGVQLTVTRQTLGWFQPKRPDLFQIGAFPVWGLEDQKGGLVYGFPMNPASDAHVGLKIARHFPAQPTTPQTVDRNPTEHDRAELNQLIADVFPEDANPVHDVATCLYTNTPDAHFIVDRHPQHENVTIATGFSGHGFKFASVVGEILADLALDGDTRHPIDFLRLARFNANDAPQRAQRTLRKDR